MPRGAIDIGSNSLLLLILSDDGKVLCDLSRVIGLGKGLGDRGRFAADRMDLALKTLGEFAHEAHRLGLPPHEIQAVATSAARRAENAMDFFDRVKHETGIEVQIISGEREAELTWNGARTGIPSGSKSVGVVDLGGGSTEIVMGDNGVRGATQSLEIGTVRLTEAICSSVPDRFTTQHRDEMLNRARRVVASTQWSPQPQFLIGVAGTATTLGASEIGLTEWNAQTVHGTFLSRHALAQWTNRLVGIDASARRLLVPVSPQRADTVLAGACILLSVCEATQIDGMTISVGGIRHGLIQ